jgi:hypothetical protein
MAEDYRAILTDKEKEILAGDADVSDGYYYRVVTRVRKKVERLEEDLDLLDEHHDTLGDELREAVGVGGRPVPDDTDTADERPAEPVEKDAGNTDDRLTTAVEKAADGWDATGEKLANRKAAARAVLEFAREHGQVSKQEAKETVYPENPVKGQSADTWYRNNVRPALNEAAEYDSSERAYRLQLETND